MDQKKAVETVVDLAASSVVLMEHEWVGTKAVSSVARWAARTVVVMVEHLVAK